MSELKTAVEVAQALERGEVVEYCWHGDATWRKARSYNWSWFQDRIIYRIKPKPLECWVNVYSKGGSQAHSSESIAREFASRDALRVAVHMREVTND